MSVSKISIGRDYTLNLTDANGTVPIGRITMFTARTITKDLDSMALNGDNYFDFLPGGWQGDIEVDRDSQNMDNYVAAAEANFYAGNRLQKLSITETINNPDGSVSQFMYTDVALKMDDAGDLKPEDYVKQKFAYKANKKIRII